MKSLKTQNYYDVLGVARYATPEEIRSAYEISRHTFQENSLATYSLFSDQENQEILALIAKAFETLFNPESRRAYDAVLSQQDGEPIPPAPRRAPSAPGHAPANHAGAGHPASMGVPPASRRPEPDIPRRMPAMGAGPGESAHAPVGASMRSSSYATGPGAAAGHAASSASVSPISPPPRPAASTPKPVPVVDTPPPNPARDEFIKTIVRFDGATLKKLRLMTGLSLEELAEKSKIRRAYIEYIEEENFQFLPAPVYVKGFVTLMANILGAPPQRAAEDYMLIAKAKKHGS